MILLYVFAILVSLWSTSTISISYTFLSFFAFAALLTLDTVEKSQENRFVALTIDSQRNRLETQAEVLMTSVIRPDTLYFGTL